METPMSQDLTGNTGTESNDSIVVDCPVCRRTIWAWTKCWHGKVPPPDPEPEQVDGLVVKGGTDNKGRRS